uniref:GST N-terminal domain-containing protein n=1 Tax=Craspedostauros australis TaxID=1486917 RepID=A0A7R9WM77_9STRA|mmetsp:Transcript_11778/g.32464  ORF Transcript_11778/g.32464 Transcript_11778/m.32464 type:complete len:240 (+) Transcript_11778:103-822(+)
MRSSTTRTVALVSLFPYFGLHLLSLLPLFGTVDAFAVATNGKMSKLITNKMCPFAQKAWIALEVSQTPYTLQEISLYGPNGKPDWFWDLNPAGTVPVFVNSDKEQVYADSDLILDSIDTIRGDDSSGLSTNSKHSQQIAEFRSKMKSFLPIGKSAVLGGSKKEMWDRLREMDADVVGPYICGDEVTVADCSAFPFLWRIENAYGSFEKEGCERLHGWLQTCKANKSFSKTVQSSWWWWW